MTKWLLTLAGLAALTATASAQAPAPDVQVFALTPQVGPWVVCVTSFMGDESARLAYDLTVELRQKYHLHAYIYNRAAEQRRQAEAEAQRIHERQLKILEREGADPNLVKLPVRKVHIEDQYAVVVGGYRDLDAAHGALEKMRRLPPPSKQFLTANLKPSQGGSGVETEYLNPFQTCMALPNPTVPHEDMSSKPDPFWKKLNANEPYSVFTCPKPWTLAVLVLKGASILKSGTDEPNALERLFGKRDAAIEDLNAIALQAHTIAQVLREMPLLKQNQMQAYVLHTRASSIVTVGAFDSMDDPRLKQMQKELAGLKLNSGQGNLQFRCFAVPRPMRVPQL
ncbi:MAG TPA: hypothetical protein VFA18_21440 [Gemmataceae bacterium]|nr:hypothetical protein [Gemmataceae bacterium]